MEKKFKGIIFDMDGTLTVPEIDFKKIRQELDVNNGVDLLEYPKSLSEKRRKEYFKKLEELEKKAYKNLKFQEGSIRTLNKFIKSGIKLSIVTRNSKSNAGIIIEKLNVNFNPILTREFSYVKPHPGTIHHILSIWNLKSSEILIIGDFEDDMICGRNAGISTCFFQNKNKPSYSKLADFTIESYDELEKIIFP
jgi:HAD superfamily hydrolase (TIGR01549 family)